MISIRYDGTMVRDFEVPKVAKRSHAGSLPLVPGRIFDVTSDELAALRRASVPITVMPKHEPIAVAVAVAVASESVAAIDKPRNRRKRR